MNKKFLSAILFGALMVSSTGTFVSCKDYDDDIDNINKELTDIKSKLSDLESKVTTGGAYVTKIESVEGGLKVSVSDGTSYNLTLPAHLQAARLSSTRQQVKSASTVLLQASSPLQALLPRAKALLLM